MTTVLTMEEKEEKNWIEGRAEYKKTITKNSNNGKKNTNESNTLL